MWQKVETNFEQCITVYQWQRVWWNPRTWLAPEQPWKAIGREGRTTYIVRAYTYVGALMRLHEAMYCVQPDKILYLVRDADVRPHRENTL